MSPAAASPGEPTGSLVTALRQQGGTRAVCGSLMALLPTIDGVALTVFTADRRVVVGAVGIGGEQAEDLQITLNEGPCLDAFHTGLPVLAEDCRQAATRMRWPGYSPRAVAAGFVATFTFPVLLNTDVIAVFNLFRATAGPLPATEYRHASHYARAAMTLLVDDVTGGEPDTGARLEPHVALLQQATGIVMTQAGVNAEAALHLIRQHAFDHARTPAEVVIDVIARRIRFPSTTTS